MDDPGFLGPFGFSLFAMVVTTLGVLGVARFGAAISDRMGAFAAFAASVLITVALVHLIPEAMERTPRAAWMVAGGFALGFILNRLMHADHAEDCGHGHPVGWTPLIGVGFHSLVDGLVYAVTFSVSFETGIFATLGLILHEAPEGVITYTLARAAGADGRRAIMLAILAAAVTTPLGVVLAYPFVSQLDGPILGDLLALSAGALLYIGAGHLLPHAEREPARVSVPAVICGAALAVAMELGHGGLHAHAHTHAHGAHDHDHAHEHADH